MSTHHDVIIIGSGPAGWTAAIYAARANLQPVVYADEPRQEGAFNVIPGGQLMFTTDVENYPGFPEGVLGPDLMDRFEKQAVHCGARVIKKMIRRVDFSTRPFSMWDSDDQLVQAHAVIISTGATANWIGLENEQRLARIGGGGQRRGRSFRFHHQEPAVADGLGEKYPSGDPASLRFPDRKLLREGHPARHHVQSEQRQRRVCLGGGVFQIPDCPRQQPTTKERRAKHVDE